MKRLLYVVIIVSFLDTFIQLPIITPYAIELGATHFLAGAIVAIYSLANMFGNIIGGHWIDEFGRKRMLLIGMLSVMISLLFYPIASTSWHLLIVRFIHGLAGGLLIPAAFAYIGDQTIRGQRGKTMAFTGASIGTSAIVGPAIGGAMAANTKVEYVFILVAVLFAITVVFVYKWIPESFKVSDRGKIQVSQFVELLKNIGVIQASLAAFALMVSNGTLAFALPLTVEELGLSSATTGILMSTFGIMALIVFLTPINRIYDRYQPIPIVTTGLILIGIALFILNFLTIIQLGYVAMVIYGLGFAFIFPSMNQMVADATSKEDRGKAYGIFYACFSLGVVFGSSISGYVSDAFGIPFIVSAVIMLLSGLVLVMIKRKATE